MTAVVELEQLLCFECGIIFGVCHEYVAACISHDTEICCPNGHKNLYVVDERDSEKVKAIRTELVAALHRAEQAEARASELAGTSAAADEVPPVPPEKRRRCSRWHAGLTLFACPKCKKIYKLPGPFENHLKKVCHVVEDRISITDLSQYAIENKPAGGAES